MRQALCERIGIQVRSAGVAAALLVLTAAPAAGQSAQNNLTISGGKTSGIANVNAAAGIRNQQLNMGVISQGDSALSSGAASQRHDDSSGPSLADRAAIAPRAFAGSSGWIAVNGASGNDNQQANLAAFAIGIEAGAAADTLLGQSRASTQPTAGPAGAADNPEHSVAVGAGAFENSSGLLQVSLIGGDRNSSANTFALAVSGGATP